MYLIMICHISHAILVVPHLITFTAEFRESRKTGY